MKELLNKLMLIEKETAKERGGYDLFALFLREDAHDKWDIIIAADWLKDNKGEALQYVARKVQNILTADELFKISRIVIIDDPSSALPVLEQAVKTTSNDATEIKDIVLFGLHIERAIIIATKNFESFYDAFTAMSL